MLNKSEKLQARKLNSLIVDESITLSSLTAKQKALLLACYKLSIFKFATEKTRVGIYSRQNNLCVYCKATLTLKNGQSAIDHFLPKKDAKSLKSFCKLSLPSNLLGSCVDCNNKKKALSISEWYGKALTLGKVTRKEDGNLESLNDWKQRIYSILTSPLVGFSPIPMQKALRITA